MLKDPRKNTKLWWIKKQHVYGGSLNYRKVSRPFDSKLASHVVFKAELASSLRFTKFEPKVRRIVAGAAARYGIKIVESAVNHDHLHVLIFTKSRAAQTRFLRLVSAALGRWYKTLRKSYGIRSRKLWKGRPFTRLVSWGRRSLAGVRAYIQRNRHEAMGFLAYQARRHRLADFLALWAEQGVRSG